MKIFIERYRIEKRFTLAELSRRSGVAASHLHGIESGTKVPTIRTLCKISKALGVPCCKLFSCD